MIRSIARRVTHFVPSASLPSGVWNEDFLHISRFLVSFKKRSQEKVEVDKKLSQFEKESLQGIYTVNSQDKLVEPSKAKKSSQRANPIDSASSSSTMK